MKNCLLHLLPTNLQKLDIYKKINSIYCRDKDYTDQDIKDYLERSNTNIAIRSGLKVERVLLDWYSRTEWEETNQATWDVPVKLESNIKTGGIMMSSTTNDVYKALINSRNEEFNPEGFKYWRHMLDPYIGTNLIQRKILEILGIEGDYFKYEFDTLQFYIGKNQKHAFIKDNKFEFEYSSQEIYNHFLTKDYILVKAHYYDGTKENHEIENILRIYKDGHVISRNIFIGNVELDPINFDNLLDSETYIFRGISNLNERPYTQESGVIDWYQNSFPVNTYDILLKEYPGDLKARALIQASLEFKNIESKLTTIKDVNCPSRLVLSDGMKLNNDKLSDMYGNDFMGVKLCFQRYNSYYISFEKDYKHTELVNSETSKIVLTWCVPTLSDNIYLDNGINKEYLDSLPDDEKDEILKIFRNTKDLCFDARFRTYESRRENYIQLLPAYNFDPSQWSASGTWEDMFNWKSVIIDKLVNKYIGYEEKSEWDDNNWINNLNWEGSFYNYHYNKPYIGPQPPIGSRIDWGWPDRSINKYPLSAKDKTSLYKIKVNKKFSCDIPEGYGRIMDGKYVVVDGNISSECSVMDGNNLYENREYQPYIDNEDKNILISRDGMLSEEWYLSGDCSTSRPCADNNFHSSIINIGKHEVFGRHSLEVVYGEENIVVGNMLLSQDNILSDERWLSGDVVDSVRPIIDTRYRTKLLRIISGAIYAKHESEFVASTSNVEDRDILLSQDSIFGDNFFLSGRLNNIYIKENIKRVYTSEFEYTIYGGNTRSELVHKSLTIDESWDSTTYWNKNTYWFNNEIYKNNILSVDSQFSFGNLSGDIYPGGYYREFKHDSIIDIKIDIKSLNSQFIERINLSDDNITDNSLLLSKDSQLAYNQLSGDEYEDNEIRNYFHQKILIGAEIEIFSRHTEFLETPFLEPADGNEENSNVQLSNDGGTGYNNISGTESE